jgi:hypothetical protein
MIKRLLTVFVLGLYFFTAEGQGIYQFTKGLAAGPCHQYGREALIKDQLAYQLFTGAMKQPAAGQTLFSDEQGKTVTWQSVEADTTGSFRGESLSNG